MILLLTNLVTCIATCLNSLLSQEDKSNSSSLSLQHLNLSDPISAAAYAASVQHCKNT